MALKTVPVGKSLTVRLNNGYEMPLIGFGTANAYNDEIIRAVGDAIEAGYRHFDGALFYANEVEVGQAIRQKINEKVVTRQELFIVSKLWCTFMSPGLVEEALRKTLKDLQLDYLDLYLMHWPMAFEENTDLIPLDENGVLKCKDVDYIDTWRAMEECVRKGLVRSIGISNFNSQQVKRIMDHCQIKPVNNQIEVHPYLSQKPLINLCRQYEIVVSAYGPIGRPGLSQDPVNDPVLIDDPIIKEIANKYSRTVAQVILRYLTMQGLPVVPKSSNRTRILENMASIEFDIAPEDIAVLDGLNRDYRLLKNIWASHHPHYPFHIPY